MSQGYQTSDEPGPGFEIIDLAPAGSLSATGDDMAHFMIAHLQEGRYEDKQILSPQTAKMMHTTVWKAFPDLAGNALGFYQQDINGHRVIAHAGDTTFSIRSYLCSSTTVSALFISVNGLGKDGLGEFIRDSLFHSFADRYFPGAASPPKQWRGHGSGARGTDGRIVYQLAGLGLDLRRLGRAPRPDFDHRQLRWIHQHLADRYQGNLHRN